MQMQASQAISSTSMRCISENIQFSMMQNSIFPQTSPQFYGFGFNEAVSENIPLQLEEGSLNAYENRFCMDTRPNHAQNSLISGVYSESPFFNFQSGPSSEVKWLDSPFFVPNHITNEYDIKQQEQRSNLTKGENTIPGSKKRPIEHFKTAIKTGKESVLGNKAPRTQNEHPWRTTKRMAMPDQEKTQMLIEQPVNQKYNTKDVQRLNKVPQRRSQKLADKITALQKLVSPYGKTDTASVLHEAALFIKVLQDQIQSSFQAIRNASVGEEYEYSQSKIMGDRKSDLKRKGFCLVPVRLTKNIIKEDSFDFNNHFSNADIDLLQHNNTTSTHF